MSFDGLVFHRVIDILDKKITGCRINKIYQISSFDFVFVLFSKTINTSLVISTYNSGSYMSLDPNPSKDKQEKNHFTNSMFYHLVNGTIKEIEQINNDRVAKFTIDKLDELGIKKTCFLYVELTGKATNIILTKDNNQIIDALHRLGVGGLRTVEAGGIYVPPFSKKLKDPFNEEHDPSISIQEQFSGFSMNIAEEFNSRLEKQDFKNIINELNSSDELFVYPNDYHLIELTHNSSGYIKKDIFEGLNEFYKNRSSANASDDSKELLKIVNREIKKFSGKVIKLESEVNNAENSKQYLDYGDSIFAFVSNLNDKVSSVTIDDGEKQFDIPLDNKISIKDNALKFYKKYQKLKNSVEMINEQIRITKENLDYFNTLKFQIENCSNEDLIDIKEELSEQRFIKYQSQNKKKNRKINIKEYEVEGVKISCGKNNVQNEYLTFKVAKYNEYFFHVKDYSGSHVIVHSDTLNENIIRAAANIAAINSQAKNSSTVPVDYTIVKNIKKIPGGKPGKVVLKNYKTIYIDPKENF